MLQYKKRINHKFSFELGLNESGGSSAFSGCAEPQVAMPASEMEVLRAIEQRDSSECKRSSVP